MQRSRRKWKKQGTNLPMIYGNRKAGNSNSSRLLTKVALLSLNDLVRAKA